MLLETIYGAFDRVAKRRHVFKVETIGDCYVAVTGIPRPQSKHALIMAKFAQECMIRLHDELERLSENQLGPSTRNLAMRCGLHSGPVTAGVLRGQKARFQLFGDTMNTAARMESTGQPHKIHVSQATADLLIDLGKGHWISKREDVIAVKGKGQMQTYWVATRTVASASSSSSGKEEDLTHFRFDDETTTNESHSFSDEHSITNEEEDGDEDDNDEFASDSFHIRSSPKRSSRNTLTAPSVEALNELERRLYRSPVAEKQYLVITERNELINQKQTATVLNHVAADLEHVRILL